MGKNTWLDFWIILGQIGYKTIDQKLYHTFERWNKSGLFEIINYISGYVNLVQLMWVFMRLVFLIEITKITSICKIIIGCYPPPFLWVWYSWWLQRGLLCSSIHKLKNKSQNFCMVWYDSFLHIKWCLRC